MAKELLPHFSSSHFGQEKSQIKTVVQFLVPSSLVNQASKPGTESEMAQATPVIAQPEGDMATASLDFEEFSFLDTERQDMQNISSEHTRALLVYLSEKYGVFNMQISLPYLILFCRHGMPPQEKRPFSIAGCISVWLNEGDAVPGDISIGDWGEGDSITIETELAADLQAFHMPKEKTLLRVATQYFPIASFISFISHSVIVEYPKQDEESWYNCLEKLPSSFQNAGVPLSYSNGPLVTTEPKHPSGGSSAHGQEDDPDYVKCQGCFSPGAMLQAKSSGRIIAGIAVKKDLETRLTVAFHCRDEESKAEPEKLGDENHFSVTQAETPVGYIDERVGTTDVGFAKLKNDIVFHNRFLDIPTTAKVFLCSADVNMNDEFLIDNVVTGRRRLRCQGLRIGIGGERDILRDDKSTLSGTNTFISLRQGVYATGSPEIHGVPKIRAGVCGCAMVRVREAGRDGGEVLEKGEISGFVHLSDPQLENETRRDLLCFADAVDDLVAAGWTIVQVPEKHGEAPGEATDDEVQAPKRRRIQA